MKLLLLLILCLTILGCSSSIKLGPSTNDPILDNEVIYLSTIQNGTVVITDTITALEYMENYTLIPKPQEETLCSW